MRILALIPARAGSRGVPDKNVQPIAGAPLLVRAVRLARRCRRPGERWSIVVSTDSRRYAALAEAAGARVPFLRPRRLATARARLVDVALHALATLAAAGERFDAVLLLSAAAPLTAPADVRAALALFRRHGGSVLSVNAAPLPADHLFRLERGQLKAPRGRRVGRRQDGATLVRLNGALLLTSPATLARHRQFFVPGRTRALPMPRERSVDIEDQLDLAWARWLTWSRRKTTLGQGPARKRKKRI